uniref:J domain-containing protein n=1 Tax=Chenopodium quinoa TaxID=63459 RepID=A0A803KRA0_CHEQI
MGETVLDEDALLKEFFAEVGEVERDNELSLMVHPDKCKHPQAKEAFGALAKAQQQLLDSQERDYVLSQVKSAKEELLSVRKKKLKKETASKIKFMVDEKFDKEYEQSEEFKKQLKLKVREILTEQEWRGRKMAMRISEEEGRLKKDEEEQKDVWKRKREHEEQWEGTRETRVSSWRDFMKSGKKGKKGEIRPPKLKTEDPNKSYVQRPVKRGLMGCNLYSPTKPMVELVEYPFLSVEQMIDMGTENLRWHNVLLMYGKHKLDYPFI